MNTAFHHIPVLEREVLDLLDPQPGDRILDCTVGLGGHAKALLQQGGSEASLVALDTDSENLQRAQEYLSEYSGQCAFHHGNFRDIDRLDLGTFDIIFADLGISSVHLDDPGKGFSFQNDGPLDMRLDQSSGETAAQLISRLRDEDIANILFEYGELRQSRKLASVIKSVSPKTTKGLVEACKSVLGFHKKSELPKIFQALRIAVNKELESLDILLRVAPLMLNTGGRFGVIAFHSLEDRRLKESLRALSQGKIDDATGSITQEANFALLTKKAVKASDQELQKNPRSRSARLRVLKKLG